MVWGRCWSRQAKAGEVGRLQEMANNQKRELGKLNRQFDETKHKHKQDLEQAALDSQALVRVPAFLTVSCLPQSKF